MGAARASTTSLLEARMPASETPVLEFVLKNYKNFNSRATRDALVAYFKHVDAGGKMFWAVAGAMSSAQLGITLAPAIRAGLVHGLSVTGANLEESLFRLVAHNSYKDFPEYRYFTKKDDTRILEERMRRVTDTSIPEDEAFRAVEKIVVPLWKNATARGERRFWHEYFYEFIQALDSSVFEGDPEACWLLEAARRKLPIVVPATKYDLQKPVKPWAYFCQISDSTTSYGSYSGATPNEKITWDKLTETTPMFVIESDATIVAPLILRALLECQGHPAEAAALIARH